MSELVTVRKNDPDFRKYLLGTFSKTHRALPVTSLNINSDIEQITFKVVPRTEISKPNFISYWSQLFKLKNFGLVILPLFVVIIKNILDNTFKDPQIAMYSFLGVLCLHAAVNLHNDYMDHMKGLDRIHPASGSRAIQNGWVTAYSVRNWSFVFLFWGILLGLPAIVKYREVMIIVAILTGLGVLGLGFYRMGLKFRRWSELSVFLLLGPLLTLGFQVSGGAGYDDEVVALGIVTGWFAVFYLHLKNFEQLMVNALAKFNNTVSSLGFEKSKKLLLGWWVIFLLLFNGYHFVFSAGYWAWFILVGSVGSSFAFLTSLANLQSPVGSGMRQLLSQARYMVLFNLSLWVLENLWYLWIMESWK